MDNRTRIQQSLDYIEENLKAEITAAELAEMARLSLFHYYRVFQQTTGLSVMQYIQRRRLLHGIYAMKRGTGKTDAALTYGFDTYAGFYKAFCREFGSAPAEFLAAGRAKRPWRIDVFKEDHRTMTHKKLREILENWNLEQENISDIYFEGTGNKNDHACSVGSEYILKFTADPEKLKKHIEVSKALEDIGLLCPVPIPTGKGEDYVSDGEVFFFLTKRLPGKQMVSHKFGAGDGWFVGEILGQLHLALSRLEDCVSEGDMLATVRDWALPKAKQILNLSEAFCGQYLQTFGQLYPKLPRQIIHRDPNPGNIICAEDRWGLLDFELAERNARIYDPCYAATAVLSETFCGDNDWWLEVFRDILNGYDSVVKLTEAERRAVPYVILANQLVCVAWFSERDKYTEIFETNKKMTVWLLERFEELRL